jgi:hypothetical protein
MSSVYSKKEPSKANKIHQQLCRYLAIPIFKLNALQLVLSLSKQGEHHAIDLFVKLFFDFFSFPACFILVRKG